MATTCDPFLPTLTDLPALPDFDGVRERRVPRARRYWRAARTWLLARRVWWRYRYVPGAPYPPRLNLDQYRVPGTWRADLRAALRNPPELQRKLRGR